MRVLITGSRAWRDYRTIRSQLTELPPGSVVVHGAATGADHMAHSAAVAFGLEVECHFPDYENYHVREAPLERNRKMVGLGADECWAFPTPNSRGTWHCVNLAEKAGIPVRITQERRDE